MNILITGGAGQLAFDLRRVLSSCNGVNALEKDELDVTNPGQVLDAAEWLKPQIIVHAAAYTRVDEAEKDAAAAFRINAYGTRNVAMAAQKVHAKLVYVSTDYVFDGKKAEAYTEADLPSPINVYGASKLLGEKYVTSSCEHYFILRTAWLYGRNGANFVQSILSRARHCKEVAVVNDLCGSPTYTHDLAMMISHLIHTEKYGLYHAANRGGCTRYELAREILQAAGISGVELVPVSSAYWSHEAARPKNSALAQTGLSNRKLPLLRDWRQALYAFFDDCRTVGEGKIGND